MHELVGQRLRHVKDPNTSGKKVIKVENDTVYFEDNGRAPLNAINTSFEVVNGGGGQQVQQPQYQQPQVQQPPMQPQQARMNENVDPSNFFSSNSSTLMDLANKIKSLDTTQIGHGAPGSYVSQAQAPQELPVDGSIPFNPNDPRILENLDPRTVQMAKQQMSQQQQQQQQVPPTQDPNVLAQFGNNVEGNDNGPVRKVNTDEIKQDLQNAQSGMSKEQSQYINQTQPIQQEAQSKFPKMKKNTKVVLNLEVEEMIPKPESVKNLNDLFEESIIDVLAREMTQELLRDPKRVEQMFIDELERVVYDKKKTTTTTRKKSTTTRKKSTTNKKEDSK